MTRRSTDECAEAEWFFAFADPMRLWMLCALVGTELTLKELADRGELPTTNVGIHANTLERAGLVTTERDGLVRRCALAANAKVTKTALTFTSPEGNTVTLVRSVGPGRPAVRRAGRPVRSRSSPRRNSAATPER